MARLDHFFTRQEAKDSKSRFDTSKIYLAEVMDTRSVLRAGDIKVWLYNSGIDKTDSTKWVIASYCSPMYGTTPYQADNQVSFDSNPTSFGWWTPMPYVGNKVFVFFPNVSGENMRAYWFGCPMDGALNSMLPGIPGQYFSENHTPTTELNNKNTDENYSKRQQTFGVRESARAEYSPLKEALETQGLNGDKLRGYSTAGSKREAPSLCYGFLSPLGNSFIIDDGWAEMDNRTTWNMIGSSTSYGKDGKEISKSGSTRYNAGFRLRTRNGTQILISDSGTIYMNNASGSAWAEISDDGHLMGYSSNGVDIASDGNINLHSKQKIVMEADEGFELKSTNGGIKIDVAGNSDITTPHINTTGIINSPEIHSKIGNIESFESKMAQCNGVFSGSLQGTALYATNAGTIAIQQPLPDVSAVDLPEVLTSDGVTDYPTHEPYNGLNHNKNASIPSLNINNDLVSEEYYGVSPSATIVSNQVTEVCPTPVDTSSDTSIPQMQLTEHFTLADLCYSSTAKARGISNVPTDAQIARLKLVAENILEKVWAKYGKVTVNSGYRGPALNAAVGGASSSQHCANNGAAVDFEINGVDNYELACWVRENLDFDQLILEFATNLASDPNSGWVHCSYKDSNRRHQCLTINKSGTRSGLIRT